MVNKTEIKKYYNELIKNSDNEFFTIKSPEYFGCVNSGKRVVLSKKRCVGSSTDIGSTVYLVGFESQSAHEKTWIDSEKLFVTLVIKYNINCNKQAQLLKNNTDFESAMTLSDLGLF